MCKNGVDVFFLKFLTDILELYDCLKQNIDMVKLVLCFKWAVCTDKIYEESYFIFKQICKKMERNASSPFVYNLYCKMLRMKKVFLKIWKSDIKKSKKYEYLLKICDKIDEIINDLKILESGIKKIL
jgi:hypothetical protein